MIDIDQESLKIISCAFFIAGLDAIITIFCSLLWCKYLVIFTFICTHNWDFNLGFWLNVWKALED